MITSSWYVTGLHGHAWTEVYFEGFGWLTFDATPRQSSISDTPEEILPPEQLPPEETPEPSPENAESEPTPSPEPSTAPEGTDTDEPTPTPEVPIVPNQEPDEADRPGLAWLWWLLPLAALAACALRILWTQPRRCAGRAKDETGRWSAWMQALADEMRVLGLEREASESPMAYMRRLDGLRRFPAKLLPLGECMALVFYGRVTPEPEETAMAAEAYQRIYTCLTRWQRVRLGLTRAFVSEKKRMFTQ